MAIRLTETILSAMLDDAVRTYPEESCGLVIGRRNGDDAIGHYYERCDNRQQTNRRRRFLIDPALYQKVEDQAERLGLEIIGIVHSHPDHADRPSEFDRAHAWPGFSYIVIAVASGVVRSYRCWRLRDDREAFIPEEIAGGRDEYHH